MVVKGGEVVNLSQVATRGGKQYASKKDYEKQMRRWNGRLSGLQELLYASQAWALLVIVQGMDAAGKDGAAKHVLAGVNPAGFRVVEFKTPTEPEARHDFMWREIRQLPQRGEMVWFNRSWYEEVLIARVHPDLLRKQRLDAHEAIWRGRYESIRAFEEHLWRNRTKVVKILLHLSKGEQRRRFLKRLDDPAKQWKIERADVRERGHWDEYLAAHDEMVRETATDEAPWHVVAADDKRSARLEVGRIVCEALEGLGLEFPEVDERRAKELAEMRGMLE